MTKISANFPKNHKKLLARAQSAEKLALGKLLYEVTLSGDDVKFGFDQSDLNDALVRSWKIFLLN